MADGRYPKSGCDACGWMQDRSLVMAEIKRLDKLGGKIDMLRDDMINRFEIRNNISTEIKVAIGKLNVKAGLWGALAGTVAAAAALLSGAK